ncbi:MAG: PQQ-binding-like beta-propeller repeat protein, partial [Nanoarchaeota archaeon]|nr:PQQ-binding-like beta-propeller repeat protein [Nanoarchaeota archaeon]
MKTNIFLALIVFITASFFVMPVGVVGQTVINSCTTLPILGQGLDYILTSNINHVGRDSCIKIVEDGVTLDCNEYKILGDGKGIGIHVGGDSFQMQNCAIGDFEQSFVANGKHDWPMFRQNPAHTGTSGGVDSGDGEQLWNFPIAPGKFQSSPVVADDRVYIGSNNEAGRGKLYAFNAITGELLWNQIIGSVNFNTAPAIADGNLYVGADNGLLYIFNDVLNFDPQTGSIVTFCLVGGRLTAATAVNGFVYIGSDDGRVLKIDPANCNQEWVYPDLSQPPLGEIHSSPAVSDGIVYFGSDDGNLYAVDAAGTLQWTFETGGTIISTPAVAGGVVYFGSNDLIFYALSSGGVELWRSGTEMMGAPSSPSIFNGAVYFGANDNRIYSYTTDGTYLGRFDTNGLIQGSIAVVDGVGYIGSEDGNFYARRVKNGQEVWTFSTNGRVYSSPAVSDGIVYFGSDINDPSCNPNCGSILYAIGHSTANAGYAMINNNAFWIADENVVLDGTGNNDFYYNSFGLANNYYVVDRSPGNQFFIMPGGGSPEGNYYGDIGSWDIRDLNSDNYGDAGSQYPYGDKKGNAGWFPKWSSLQYDYGPIMQNCFDDDGDGYWGYDTMCPYGPDCNDYYNPNDPPTNCPTDPLDCANLDYSTCPICINPGPDTLEHCFDNVDNNCDGFIDYPADPSCFCLPFDTDVCGSNIGRCEPGEMECDVYGHYGDCGGPNYVGPIEEICDNGIDDDCDATCDSTGCEDPKNPGNTFPPDSDCTCISTGPETGSIFCSDGLDNDCDLLIDCLDSDCSTDPVCVGECIIGETDICGSNIGECFPGKRTCLYLGGVGVWGDCEEDPVNPGYTPPTAEVCDALDNDCDNEWDEGYNSDPITGLCSDGTTPCTNDANCLIPGGICDFGIDDTFWDNDGDLYTTCGSFLDYRDPGQYYGYFGIPDCNDNPLNDQAGWFCPLGPLYPLDPSNPCLLYPSLSECAICIHQDAWENCYDGIDNNCNTYVDCVDLGPKGCGGIPECNPDQCRDLDGDGYGDPESPLCTYPGRDCDDTNKNINPGEIEDCYDNIDNNCNGQCDFGGCPGGEPADIHCESPQANPNYFFPEGIYNVHPFGLGLCDVANTPPCSYYENGGDARNFKFDFSIITYHVTAPASSTVGCTVSQSNCQSDQIAGCNRINVEGVTTADLTDGVFGESGEVSHMIDATDSVERQIIEGGDTVQQWIPWEIDECYVKNPAGIDIRREPVNWRIHVHSINDQNTLEWTSNEVHFADFCWLGQENNLFLNTIKCDFEGDVDVALKYKQGTGIESYCHDGADNDGDGFVDGADSDCNGITYSWLPKKDIADERACTSDIDCDSPKVCLDGFCSYSPSGSVQFATADPPTAGNVRSDDSNAATRGINILWTEHVNPNNGGKFKIRFRRWDIGNGILGVIADGFPKIEVVRKYGPGSTIDYGLLPYFSAINVLTGETEYVPRDMLDQTDLAYVTHDNKFIMQSTVSNENIAHLDTSVEAEFDPATVNTNNVYNIDLTIVYTTPGGEVNNDFITIPVYFCTDAECPGLDNINENAVDLSTTDWKTCSDAINNDFDYLNKAGNEQSSFAASSYDCYDINDCNNEIGTSAYNAYTGTYTGGPGSDKVCTKDTEIICADSYNNDWYKEDLTNGHQNTDPKTMLPDCRDIDCDGQTGPTDKFGNIAPDNSCEYSVELDCDVVIKYDNDHYNLNDCELQPGGTYNNAEYDCSSYCRSTIGTTAETGAMCDDNIDNDWDKWILTTGGLDGYAIQDGVSGTGMDCAWIDNYPDEDCNGETLSNGKICELGAETICDDSFDNDFDNGYTTSAGWDATFYNEYFGPKGMTYAPNADCDDYDNCKDATDALGNSLCPTAESQFAKWCFDGADNDLDRFDGGGIDCGDTDCIGVVNPDNPAEICTRDEYSASNPIQCFDGQDNDADGNGNPSDPQGNTDCYDNTVDASSPPGSLECNKNHPFSPGRNWCAPCAAVEMTKWDGCADNKDNDYDIPSPITNCDDSDCYMQVGDYDHHFCEYNGITRVESTCDDGFDNDGDGSADCADSDCSGQTGKDGQTCGSENCNDNGDNDGDGFIDCQDTGCYSSCQLDYKSGGDYSPKSASSTFGIVDATWSERVRDGDDYTIRFRSTESYTSIQIIVGSSTGSDRGINLAPPYDGLDVDSVNNNIDSLSGDK